MASTSEIKKYPKSIHALSSKIKKKKKEKEKLPLAWTCSPY